MSDHPALHQVDQERCDSGLDDVSPEHDDDRPLVLRCEHDGLNHRAKVCSDENVRKTCYKRGE